MRCNAVVFVNPCAGKAEYPDRSQCYYQVIEIRSGGLYGSSGKYDTDMGGGKANSFRYQSELFYPDYPGSEAKHAIL